MGELLIRKVPPGTLDALKKRAKRRGRTVQAEVRELLEQATRPAGAGLVDVLIPLRLPVAETDAAMRAIREARDAR